MTVMIPLGGIGRTKAKLNVEKTFDMLRSRHLYPNAYKIYIQLKKMRMMNKVEEKKKKMENLTQPMNC